MLLQRYDASNIFVNNYHKSSLFFPGLTYDEVVSFVPQSFDGDEMESWGRSTFSSTSRFPETLFKDYQSHVTIHHFPHTHTHTCTIVTFKCLPSFICGGCCDIRDKDSTSCSSRLPLCCFCYLASPCAEAEFNYPSIFIELFILCPPVDSQK